MLKVNVGLSRKLTHDYNSTGFSINVEGEITAPPNDPEAVVNGIRELYDLAEEALDLQVERFQSDSAIASRDEPRSHQPKRVNGHHASNGSHPSQNENSNGNGKRGSHDPEAATQKQMNYLLTLAKRHELSTMALEHRIQELLGQPIGIYELTKREAATVIDDLTSESSSSRR